MTLTREAQKGFEEWYLANYIYNHREDYIRFGDANVLRKFYRMHEAMQFGVYQDYADSVGIYLNTILCGGFMIKYKAIVNLVDVGSFNTRPEARTAAIEKLDEILNN